MIAEWERELGAQGAPPSAVGTDGDKKKPTTGDPAALVRAYQFFNKSQPEAAKGLLEFVGHPLLTQQIVEGIEKGGVSVGGKTPKDKKMNLYTILQRSSEFVRWKRDTWGLPSWSGAPKRNEAEEPDEKPTEEKV
jgi:hypothetical protein